MASAVIPEAFAYTSNFASPNEHWEVKVVATDVDVEVKGAGLALGNVDKDPIRNANHGPPTTWNISTKNG